MDPCSVDHVTFRLYLYVYFRFTIITSPQMVIIETFINLHVFMSNVLSRIAVRELMYRHLVELLNGQKTAL